MNVIVANKYQLLLENLGIDIIKEINGEFTVDEIINTFQNFFYQRMILDITAIKEYKNITNLQKLSISLNMDKVILLLDGTDDTCNPAFISQLISMGIYNFARDVDGIQYLYNNPNSYRDVAQYHQIQTNQIQQQPSKTTNNVNNVSQNVQTQSSNVTYANNIVPDNTIKIIGLKNITKHAGASTLAFMMKNTLSKRYKTVAIEVDKMEFAYFRDKSMVSTTSPNFKGELTKYADYDVIIVDLNNSVTAEGLCQLVLNIVEPTTIKINKLITVNPSALRNLKSKRVILNQCLLSKNELMEFEYEAKIKSFYTLPPINERDINNNYIIDLLRKLGFNL